jgi:hypothetical protein
MYRSGCILSFLVLTLAGLCGCSSKPSGTESGKPAAAPDKIQGKAQVNLDETAATDTALNAGGPSVYLIDGLHHYRLFLNKPFEVEAGKEYVAEGVIAQKAIDEIGDPDQGKNGYPLPSSCERVVRMAWKGLPFDVVDLQSQVLAVRVKRYPARPVFLVTRISPVTPAGKGAGSAAPKKEPAAEEKNIPVVSVAADKQRAFLIEGPAVQTAPLWAPAGDTVHCKVVINPEGKISELETGMQLCEAVPWPQFRYRPPVKNGHPVKVETEVEVRFEPRK